MKRCLLILLGVPVGGTLGGLLAAVGSYAILRFMGGGNSHSDAVGLYGMTVLGGIAGAVLGPFVTFFLARPTNE